MVEFCQNVYISIYFETRTEPVIASPKS